MIYNIKLIKQYYEAKGFPKYCNDLKMEADRIWRETGKDTKFDKPKDAHNALVGAHFNYNFHKFLNTL